MTRAAQARPREHLGVRPRLAVRVDDLAGEDAAEVELECAEVMVAARSNREAYNAVF